ncbi:hypothetical protein HS7_18460 [Sulfolobales archaeon HS-7]|nr:hypothetical protein HS7_18460 [Sulfolobales archaeon HS-7]
MKRTKMKTILDLVIISNLTLDVINNTIRPGGPALYSGFGVAKAGGYPTLIGHGCHEYPLNSLPFKFTNMIVNQGCNIFQITYYGSKRTLKLIKASPPIRISSLPKGIRGVIVNPVFHDVNLEELLPLTETPLALDIQGFLRNIRGDIVIFEKADLPKYEYFVTHASIDELQSAGYNIEEILKLGSRETIISYGEDGFEVYLGTNLATRTKPTELFNNPTGAGDLLIGSYFTFRISGYDVIRASELSRGVVENSLKELHTGP